MSAAGLLALAAAAAAAPAPGPSARVQIAIVRQAAAVTLAADGSAVLTPPGGSPRSVSLGEGSTLKARVGGLRLAGLSVPTETRLTAEPGKTLKVGRNPHRGPLILRLDPGQTVTVVEDLDLEDYLEGVLPHEMDPDWPLEALKAQAVVARTFAYANLGKFRKDGFDLTSDTRSQVYKGLSLVNENVRSAVRQTRGEVLGFDGRLLKVFYHACCGGATTDPKSVWGSASDSPPPLKGVKDPWCRLSPHMGWSAYFAWADIAAAIGERRVVTGPLTALRLGVRDAAGYARTFLAKAAGKTVEVPAGELRTALGAGELRSLRLVAVSSRKKGAEFRGAGSGHGVGLCQWGAKLQALKGRTYEEILRFYFPGSVLSEVAE